jgi:NADH:ubiquinone oxidoreductase subunit F (NADH-binding)
METTDAPTDLTIATWPGSTPRLLRDPDKDYGAYVRAGGYQPLDDPDALLEEVALSGLLGRGGAAFPLAVKLRAVRDNGWAAGGAVVVANGEEGEPASIKDRWLLRHRPHLVLDGLRLAARMVGADRAYVYVSDALAANSVERALSELDPHGLDGLTVSVVTVEPGYIAGEETAAVRVINGGPAKPTDKPPRPFEQGVDGYPTLVSNVETLGNLPYLLRHGSNDFRAAGTSASPGTFLITLTGGARPPALYEIPFGVDFTDLIERYGVNPDRVGGVLMGGYFAGFLNRVVLNATVDHEAVRRLGSGLGAGAMSILTDECPVAVAASVMAYFDRENASQCGSCFNGTAAMSAVTSALRDGVATQEDLARLERWSVVLRGRGACATLDAACNVAASLLVQFPQVVTRHLDNDCDTCRVSTYEALRPYEVEAVVTV